MVSRTLQIGVIASIGSLFYQDGNPSRHRCSVVPGAANSDENSQLNIYPHFSLRNLSRRSCSRRWLALQ